MCSNLVNVHIMTGVPGCGKSTFVQKECERLRKVGLKALVVSFDEVVEEIGKDLGLTYDEVHIKMRDDADFAKQVRWMEVNNWVSVAQDPDVDTIFVDRTNMSVKSRQRSMNMIRSNNLPRRNLRFISTVFMPPKSDEEYKRLMTIVKSRKTKTIPEYVVEDMISRWEPPTFHEKFAQVNYERASYH